MSAKGQQYRYRPDYILDVDTISEWVDFMLDYLERSIGEIQYQNCITVLDHLMACDETVYGNLLQQEGHKLDHPGSKRIFRCHTE